MSEFNCSLEIEKTLQYLNCENSLNSKWALITGASSGIGFATAVALAKEGVKTILVARRKERLQEIQKEFLKLNFPECKIVCADVCKKEDREKINREMSSNKISIFINNAGLALGLDSVENAKSEDWETMINTNITSSFLLCQMLVKHMIENKSGHIIHVGSIAGRTPYENGSVYTATKHALRAFSESLRQELCNTPIKNSLVSPGMVETEFSKVRFSGNSERSQQVYKGLEPLCAADVALAIVTCLKQRPHVSFDDLLVMPQAQGGVFKVARNQK
jgi:3-hydroxy acid dehydrogenase / malonic semialdehyde reductase